MPEFKESPQPPPTASGPLKAESSVRAPDVAQWTPAAELLDWKKATRVAIPLCLLMAVFEGVNSYVVRYLDGNPRNLAYIALEQLPWWLLWCAFMPLVLWLARTYRFDTSAWPKSAWVHALLGLTIAIAHGALYGVFVHLSQGPNALGITVAAKIRWFLLRYLFTDVATYAAAVGIYYSFEYFSSFRSSALAKAVAEARAARLELSLAEARLHALRMELNPHFLFNALNAVAGLVRRREHDSAIEMLTQLGELLRAMLTREMPAQIPLTDELTLLRKFLDIEQVRFGDRLRIVWEIEREAHSALVPPLILQPVVENALRHGISRRPGPAVLSISARRIGLQLELAVRDSGEGLAAHQGRIPREGIGLSNIRARLEQQYGAASISLELVDAIGGGARARLLLPFHISTEQSNVALGA